MLREQEFYESAHSSLGSGYNVLILNESVIIFYSILHNRIGAFGNVADNCMDAGYNVNYGNPEAGYAGNHYPASYSLNPVSVAILCEFLKIVVG